MGEMAENTVTFLSIYSLLGELIIPKYTNQVSRNLDEIKEDGMYACLGDSVSWPAKSGGLLFVITMASDRLIQVATDGDTSHMRMFWDETWYKWILIG